MFEWILSYTNLPNLHPALVHFPIVLLGVALLSDVLAFLFPTRDWLRKAALFLYVLGALAAGATFWSGRQAADSFDLPPAAQSVLSQHENLALYTLWFFGIYAALRLFLPATGGLGNRRWLHALMVAISVGGQGLVFATADQGGALVYRHAVGVERPQEKPAQIAIRAEPAAGPVIENEKITWSFGPGSEKKLGEYFEIYQGNPDQIQGTTETAEGKSVLILRKDSVEPLILLFQHTYGDVQIEGEFDTSSFNGSFALVHHTSAGGYDFFLLSGKHASLGRKTGANQTTFGKKDIELPAGLKQIKVVSANKHFRGYVGGKLIVHGHGKDAAPGKAGFLMDGSGSIRIARIAVTPLAEQEHHEH